MKYPAIRNVIDVIKDTEQIQAGLPDGRYVPARPEPFYWGLRGRLRIAWLVFKGEADALIWPGQ